MELITAATRERLTAMHPEVATELGRLESILDDSTLDPQLLQLVSNYFDAELGGNTFIAPENPSPLEQACLKVCEQFMISVADTNDAQIAGLSEHLSPDDVYNLMYAIYLIEMSKRLDITLERVL